MKPIHKDAEGGDPASAPPQKSIQRKTETEKHTAIQMKISVCLYNAGAFPEKHTYIHIHSKEKSRIPGLSRWVNKGSDGKNGNAKSKNFSFSLLSKPKTGLKIDG